MQSAPIRFSREKSRSVSSGRGADPARQGQDGPVFQEWAPST